MRIQEGVDPEDPLVFDSQQLHRQPGASQKLQREVPIDTSWRNDVSAAVSGGTIPVEFLLESAHDGILVAAQGRIPLEANCVRCLNPTEWQEDIHVQQFYAYPEHANDGDVEAEGDVAEIRGDYLDFRDAFRDAVVLALPLTPTCSEDCLGLCSQCGFVMAKDPQHKHEEIDPRWSELAKFADPDRPAQGE